MKRVMTKTIETLKVSVSVGHHDIYDGICLSISRCMHKVAIERALRKLDPRGGDHKTRVDAGIIKFNLDGHRWTAIAPKILKQTLVVFDRERKARARAAKLGEDFVSKVVPHGYRIEAQKGAKIQPLTRERQDQINEARRQRVAAGRPDKNRYDIRHRIEGMGNV